MKEKNVYPIRYVARETGLSTHTIRIWEKRYQTINPKRTDSNRRVYNVDDIQRLHLLKKAVTAGHSISQIANLSSNELARLLKANITEAPKFFTIRRQSLEEKSSYYSRSLDSVINLDIAGLESALDQAAVHLTKPELIDDVIEPLCKNIGALWRKGELKIVHEHMATTVIRSFLWNLLRSVEVYAGSPKIIIATPSGHKHELGALAIGLIACESGWRSLYFGPSLPAEEIAAAAAYTDAQAVALSVTYHTNNHQLRHDIKKLKRYLNNDIALLIGGQSAWTIADLLNSASIQILKNTESFKLALDTLLASRLSEFKNVTGQKGEGIQSKSDQ